MQGCFELVCFKLTILFSVLIFNNLKEKLKVLKVLLLFWLGVMSGKQNGILGMGMMVSPNSNLSVPQLNHQQQVNHYQQTPHAPFNPHHLPPQQVPYNMYTSSSIASSANTANTVSQVAAHKTKSLLN